MSLSWCVELLVKQVRLLIEVFYAGYKLSFVYSGALPSSALHTFISNLYSTRRCMGSQWRSLSTSNVWVLEWFSYDASGSVLDSLKLVQHCLGRSTQKRITIIQSGCYWRVYQRFCYIFSKILSYLASLPQLYTACSRSSVYELVHIEVCV